MNIKSPACRQAGFTLVELLVVIAIMSVLTVITVSQFQTAQKKANDVARKGDLNAVAKALQMYYADYGKMPNMSDPLGGQIKVGGNVIPWGGQFIDAAGYVYMQKLPIEGNLAFPYCYKTDANNKAYALFAMLENTLDNQCIGGAAPTYKCGNPVKNYCFAYYSPNVKLDSNGNITF
ncbi:MAG: prepilin-type N-terminal cleavage/methylation domain-containing protein [Candidatus Shapirobacteria bacterium]|jgi:type II secretion system protein G